MSALLYTPRRLPAGRRGAIVRSSWPGAATPSGLGFPANPGSRPKRERAEAFLVLLDPILHRQQRHVVELAGKNRLPAIYPLRASVEAGGLLAYGADLLDLYRRAAGYVDKILKGAKPGGLADRATHEVRTGRQSEHRQSSQSDDPAGGPGTGRSSDRSVMFGRPRRSSTASAPAPQAPAVTRPRCRQGVPRTR